MGWTTPQLLSGLQHCTEVLSLSALAHTVSTTAQNGGQSPLLSKAWQDVLGEC
jgi:hypothetical protein